jgi:glycosyltransferase involved in cell wall biosynthesis
MSGHLFVVPPMEAMLSGGNVYNLGLTTALRRAGADVRVVDLAGAEAALSAGASARVWIDSLYLEALPRLAEARPAGASLYLIAHYLPSLVARGAIPPAAELSLAERAALALADGFLAPSPYMARALAQLGAAPRPILVVPPGSPVDGAPVATAAARDVMQTIVVANVVPGKGVLPLVDALAPWLQSGTPLQLTVVGSLAFDAAYATRCRQRIAEDPALAAAVRFAGPLAHAATLAAIAASDLLVSPSRMESFGLALAEARALGVPIVARDGGNAAAHVDEAAGGRLFASDEALAAECAHLARDRVERLTRARAAQAARPRRRSWDEAARELCASE